MAKIAINGRNLHEVEMKHEKYDKGTNSYLLYPEHRIKIKRVMDKIIVKLPSFLALELFRSAIIPQNEDEAFPVRLDGKDIGLFRVIDLRYPLSSDTDELISMTFTRMGEG
jgi:hypothetical protein